MNIYYIQELWFPSFYNPGDSPTASFLTIDLPNVNVKAYIALNAASIGSTSDRVPGVIAAGIQSYDQTDTEGHVQHVDVPWLQAHATVYNCTRITFGVQGNDVWGAAVGVLYWFD